MRLLSGQRRRVYPRACGGTPAAGVSGSSMPGLSPRVRGNQTRVELSCWRPGSIPARAGEPRSGRAWTRLRRVYPRACGGTELEEVKGVVEQGLSPRVRGNRNRHRLWRPAERSIPARAGEPRAAPRLQPPSRVYPRACGGTRLSTYRAEVSKGLSPRVRRNHSLVPVPAGFLGSIPARAGEPGSASSPATAAWVYPRACGGTRSFRGLLLGHGGLSPRVRGNPGSDRHGNP